MARTELEQLVYQMSADIRQLEKTNQRALGNVDRSANQMQRRYDRLAKEMGQDFGRISLLAGAAFGAITVYATKAAGDAAETANAFSVAFGSAEKDAQAFAASYSKDVGRAFVEVQDRMANAQLVLKGLGATAEQALPMVEALVRRSVDFASLRNIGDAQAFEAFISGITGETEPLKKFGVVINETATKAELLRLGFKGNAEQAPELAKAMARLNLIMQKTVDADNDAIKTKTSLNNQVKVSQANFHDAAVELGKNFVPTATKAIQAANGLLDEFNQMPDSVKLAGLAFLGLVAAGGPLAAAITGLMKLIQYAGLARAALVSVALGGAAVAAVPVVGAVAFGVSATKRFNDFKARSSLSDSKVRATSSDEDLQGALVGLKADEAKNAKNGRTSYATAIIAKVEADLQKRASASAAAAAAKVEGDIKAAFAGFSLTDDLKTPVGGTKTKTGKSAAEKAADKERSQKDRYLTEMARLQDQELQARQGQNLSIQERAKIELARIDAEQKAYAEDVSRTHDVGESRAKLLVAAKKTTSDAERAAVIAQRDADLQDAKLAQDRELADLNIQMLQISGATADSLLERLAVEERILAIRQAQEKAALEDYLSHNPNVTNGDAQRQALDDLQAATRKDLRRVAGEELKGGILDAFEAAKGGLEGLAEFFGQRIRDKLKDKLADVAADFLISIAKNKAGSALGSIASVATAILGHRATGGPVQKGVPYITGENGQEVFVPSSAGRIISNSSLRKMGSSAAVGGQGGGDVYLAVTVNADGAIPREEIQMMVQRGSLQAVQAARGLTRADIARSSQQRLGRR